MSSSATTDSRDDDLAAMPEGTGVLPLVEVASQAGLDLLAAMRDGRVPHAPITGLMDFWLTHVEKGHVVFTGRPKKKHYNPIGTVHGGWISTLLDSAMGCSIHSTLASGEAYTTLEIKINFVKAVTTATGEVRAESRVTSRGRRVATSDGRLVDAAGNVLALGTTTCLIFPLAEAGSRAAR
jgi:uncharacterized protein (TIGR00369 family)